MQQRCHPRGRYEREHHSLAIGRNKPAERGGYDDSRSSGCGRLEHATQGSQELCTSSCRRGMCMLHEKPREHQVVHEKPREHHVMQKR